MAPLTTSQIELFAADKLSLDATNMSFRKRNVGITDSRRPQPVENISPAAVQLPGVRPSTADGRPVTSSGSSSFDGLFAGHGGIPLGTSVLVQENGTTDYAGALLRFFAAEGLLQGHHVQVVGLPDVWGRELPGLASNPTKSSSQISQDEKMKIAWRYEKLGQHESDSLARDRGAPAGQSQVATSQVPFCHTFDLSKRLEHPSSAQLTFLALDLDPRRNCFGRVITALTERLHSSASNTIHRLIIPGLMSPALYPPHVVLPAQILTFQYNLRKLLAEFPKKLVILQTLPLSLFPRSLGLTRWVEVLNDGVYSLTPFPHSADAEFASTRDPSTKEEPPQGLLSIHKMPIFHEIGTGTIPTDTDWTFSLSRRRFTIKPYNLPPLEGDTEAQNDASEVGGKARKPDMEF